MAAPKQSRSSPVSVSNGAHNSACGCSQPTMRSDKNVAMLALYESAMKAAAIVHPRSAPGTCFHLHTRTSTLQSPDIHQLHSSKVSTLHAHLAATKDPPIKDHTNIPRVALATLHTSPPKGYPPSQSPPALRPYNQERTA
jgi:hypothetical protein